MKKTSQVLNKKINFTKKVTEEQLLAAIENPDSLSENPHIVSVYSATLNEDDFELDESQGTVKPIKAEFFKSMESKVDPSDSDKIDRLKMLKNQVLEKVKVSKKSRERSLSVCSVRSTNSEKRKNDGSPARSVRPKTTSGIPLAKV